MGKFNIIPISYLTILYSEQLFREQPREKLDEPNLACK